MKKVLIYIVASMFIAASAYAEKRIGVSVAYTMFDSSGTEETKSSGEKNSTSVEEDVIVPAIFFEIANDNGIALGIDYTPADSELGSGKNSRTDTDTDDASDSAGDNDASAELSGHYTLYGLLPVGSRGAYLKAGVAHASIDTTETLATGTEYGNADVNGILVGLGFNRESGNGGFFRMEGTYTDYEDVSLKSSVARTGVTTNNKIDADLDTIAFKYSYAF